ncbi:MAG: hypothetical protein FWC06_06700 [Treponema sp.]|nr:hypothetical protein [Treponema sp.]
MGSSRYTFIKIIAIITFVAAVITCGSAPAETQNTPVDPPLVSTSAAGTPNQAGTTQTEVIRPVEVIPVEEPKIEIKAETIFNPANISQEYYASTREEVRQFIDRLNTIISNRNYTAWEASLSSEYITELSSHENLERISETPLLKLNNTVLRNLNDYFVYIVVPSRSSSRINIEQIDIIFLNENRVRAYVSRMTSAGESSDEILYDLEKINNIWKIIN